MTTWAYQYDDPPVDRLQPSQLWEGCDRLYHDIGQRQQRAQLLLDCRDRPPDYLQIRQLGELGDNWVEIGSTLRRLDELGIEISEIDPALDSIPISLAALLDPASVRRLDLQFAREHSRRLQQGHARNRLKALPPPGKAPYGYRRGRDRYLIDRSTSPAVKAFFEQFLLYGSLRRAVRHLETRYGKAISVSTGRRWLSHPVYRGDLLYHTGEVVADTHAPLLSREEAAQIDRLLRRNRTLPPRTASTPRSLAGLVRCQNCQSPMAVAQVKSKNRDSYLYLRPTQCPQRPKCRAIAYEKILEQTIHCICEDFPPTVSRLDLPDLEGIKSGIECQIREKKALIERLPDLQANGILDEATATLRQYNLRAEIAQLYRDRDRLPPGDLKVIARAVSLPQFWMDLSESERRFYFREFIRRIELVRSDNGDWQVQVMFVF